MAGVNTKLSFEFLEEWIEKSPISVSAATLIFDVVPEEESGIQYEDLPNRLMLGSLLEDELAARRSKRLRKPPVRRG